MLKLPSATLGLGVYLPFSISSIMGVGSIIFIIASRFVTGNKKDGLKEKTNLIASGFLGGEGITGVVLAIIFMVS